MWPLCSFLTCKRQRRVTACPQSKGTRQEQDCLSVFACRASTSLRQIDALTSRPSISSCPGTGERQPPSLQLDTRFQPLRRVSLGRGLHRMDANTLASFDFYRLPLAACDSLWCPVLSHPTPQHSPSLPLDRPRRLRGHVIDHAVDAAHLVDDPRRDAGQEIHREGEEVGGHAVRGGHRS